MITINLLPWRQQQRKVANNIFYSCFVMIFLVISAGYLFVWVHYYDNINNLKTNNNYLTQEFSLLQDNIASINYKIQCNKKIIKRTLEFDDIKARRNYILSIVTDISRSLSGDIYLSSLEFHDAKLVLIGSCSNNNMLINLTNKVQRLPWCKAIELSEITNASFKLQLVTC